VVAGCPKIYGQLVQLLSPYSSLAPARDGASASP
jgi:hypothetical protein